MHQLTVQPTWKTTVVRKRLKGSANGFRIDLMDGAFIKALGDCGAAAESRRVRRLLNGSVFLPDS